MTWCQNKFLDFNEKIRLDNQRRDRIDNALYRFIEFAKCDDELRAAMNAEPFLQGSVATDTVIKPLTGDEYDVDVIYPFKMSVFNGNLSPEQLFNWFVQRLETSDFYKKRLTRKNRCVRIAYSGDFHIDLIPSTAEIKKCQPLAVPARDLMDWITNNPIGFSDWVKSRDTASGLQDRTGAGVFVRCVRIVKRWRDHNFSVKNSPSSMLLVTMLGKHEASHQNYTPKLENTLFDKYKTDAAYLYDLLRLTHGCLSKPNPKAFENPVVSGENLAQDWEGPYLSTFLNVLGKTNDALKEAIYSKDENQSLKLFREAIGDSFS